MSSVVFKIQRQNMTKRPFRPSVSGTPFQLDLLLLGENKTIKPLKKQTIDFGDKKTRDTLDWNIEVYSNTDKPHYFHKDLLAQNAILKRMYRADKDRTGGIETPDYRIDLPESSEVVNVLLNVLYNPPIRNIIKVKDGFEAEVFKMCVKYGLLTALEPTNGCLDFNLKTLDGKFIKAIYDTPNGPDQYQSFLFPSETEKLKNIDHIPPVYWTLLLKNTSFEPMLIWNRVGVFFQYHQYTRLEMQSFVDALTIDTVSDNMFVSARFNGCIASDALAVQLFCQLVLKRVALHYANKCKATSAKRKRSNKNKD